MVGTWPAKAAALDDVAHFEAKIRPVLVKHCYECHSSEAGRSKGGLLLDTRQGIQAGGETGPAVVPGKPDESLLLSAIRHTLPDLEMPPRKPPLSAAVIADFEAWIKAGAPDPREATAKSATERPPVDLVSGRKFWAYQHPAAHPLPPVRSAQWPARELDHFVLSTLEAQKLAPSEDAVASVLLRRLHLDLIGLPPTPAQVAAFEKAYSTHAELALSQVVDALLQSADFGIRWGRHWLDVARYAESNGRESNLAFPHAWRYRDYVIDAFNTGVPFDRFITEQIAGDLLPAATDAERARLWIATGFLAMGAKGLNEMNKAQFAADLADEQLDTVTRAIMASSVACARCHDHKSEPFRMEDYYALAGVFKSTETFYGTWIDSENNNGSHLIRLPELPGQFIPNASISPAQVQKLRADLAKLNRDEQEQNEFIQKAGAEGRDISSKAYELLANALRILWSRGGIEGQLETVDESGRALPLCMGVQEARRIQDSWLYDRGELAHPVKSIPRGFPEVVVTQAPLRPASGQSGRLELAQWLVSPDHPLTARVMANRVWRHLLGAGLVRTVDNFGFAGERPSHPELLDHLALRFMEEGWSIKALIREIVLSRTYRQASTFREEGFKADPDNRLLWRANKRRLDAEVIRDAMLAVSGQLDGSRRPGSVVAELTGQSLSLIGFNDKIPKDLDGSRRRSIYLPVIRNHLPDILEQFDFATPTLVTGDRDVTNVPLQALYLLNGAFVRTQAQALAERLLRESSSQDDRISLAFSLCFSRSPDVKEKAIAQRFFESQSGDELAVWSSYCQALLSTAEWRNVD